MEREGFSPVERPEIDIENVEEVFPGGYRLTKGQTTLDVPESWAIDDGEGLFVIDPGGELPIESVRDAVSLKSVAAAMTNSLRSHKLEALRQLEEQLGKPVKGILLTHGDADHTNNLENVGASDVPVYIGRKGWWSTLSPEKQFAAGKVNLKKSALTGHETGDLHFRDIAFQLVAEGMQNPRGGRMRHERKQELAKRFHDYPESFALPDSELNVVPTPGHAPEEVGFFIPDQKIFIGGDLITTSKPDQSGRLNLFLPEANVYQAMSTIDRLLGMEIEKYFPAHGDPIIGQAAVQAHLERVRADAQNIIDRTLNEHQHDPSATVQQLRTRVFTQDLRMNGMAPRSEETWILSILRDRPE